MNRIGAAISLHELSARSVATRERIVYREYAELAKGIRHLTNSLGDLAEDLLWVEFIRHTKRVLRDLCLTPLPPSYPGFALVESTGRLDTLLSSILSGYSEELGNIAFGCIGVIETIAISDANPLGDHVMDVLSTADAEQSCVVVLSRHVEAISDWLRSTSCRAEILTERMFGLRAPVETALLLGPSSWFSDWVLSAPRASSICFIGFDWMRDSDSETRLLPGSVGFSRLHVRDAKPVARESRHVETPFEVMPSFLDRSFDWVAISNNYSRPPAIYQDELVEARLYLLGGGFGTYVEASGDRTIDVVGFEGGTIGDVFQLKAAHLTPGTHVILRLSGGRRDYVSEMADNILGDRRDYLRNSQLEWKKPLRLRVNEVGVGTVAGELQAAGLMSPNVRHWISPSSIRPQSQADFRRLLQYLGLQNIESRLWADMAEIYKAHPSAGHKTRSALKELIRFSDADTLAKAGFLTIELPELHAGALGVFRIEAMSPKTEAVTESTLREPFEVRSDLWLG